MAGYSRKVHKHRQLLHHMHIGLSAVIVWTASRTLLSAVVTLHARIGCYYVTYTCPLLLHHMHVSAVVTSHARFSCCYVTCPLRLLLHHMYVSAVVTSHARTSSYYTTCTYQLSLRRLYVSANVTSHTRIGCYYITCIGISCFLTTCVRIGYYCTRSQVLAVISSDWWLSALLHLVHKDRPLCHQLRKYQLSLRHVRKRKL